MVIFTRNYLSGLDRDQANSWENIILNWIENNWTIETPPKYDPDTAPFGVLFGSDYYGHWDLVASTKIMDDAGIASELMSVGGRHEKNTVFVTFVFSVRKYSGQQGDEIPAEVTYVSDFVSNLILRNPKALQNEGIRNMMLMRINDGELEMYGQQIYEMTFVIKCVISRINLE